MYQTLILAFQNFENLPLDNCIISQIDALVALPTSSNVELDYRFVDNMKGKNR